MNIARLNKMPVDSSVVQRMRKIKLFIPIQERIRKAVVDETNVDPLELRIYRGAERVQSRQLFIVMMVKHSSLTYREIGQLMRKDHATVSHSLTQVNNLYETDKRFRFLYDRIDNKIKML